MSTANQNIEKSKKTNAELQKSAQQLSQSLEDLIKSNPLFKKIAAKESGTVAQLKPKLQQQNKKIEQAQASSDQVKKTFAEKIAMLSKLGMGATR